MTPLRILSAIFCLISIFTASEVFARSGGWYSIREQAMRLKEANRSLDAYRVAASFAANNADMVDAQFIDGWIALRNLNRPDIALEHFKNMTAYISYLPSNQQNLNKAKAGYWLGRALTALGRKDDAKIMYRAAVSYGTTYYGQLAASEVDMTLDRSHLQKASGSFPVMDFYWHDQRAKKELVLAVIREESRFRQEAVSPANAIGMMQVMNGTAKQVGRQAGINIDLTMMRKNKAYNIAVGSKILGDLMAKYGNTVLAVAAYNAGPQRVDEWLQRFGDPRGGRVDPIDWVENIPFKETREYAQKVLASYITYLTILN